MQEGGRSVGPGQARLYIRDGVPGLTLGEQEARLKQAGIDVDDVAEAYRDKLSPAALRRREPGSLKERARLLREAASGTPAKPVVICVAELRCLGWNMADIARTLAAAGRQGIGAHVADTGQTFSAATLDPGLLEALADADEAWRRGQTEDGRTAAAAAIAAKAEAARRVKLDQARPLWAKPPGEISGSEIAKTVGLSLRSLNQWLGPRSKARTSER